MFCFLACLLVLIREAPTRPTKGTGSAAPSDAKALFQLVKQNIWEENVNLSSLTCEELQAQTWTSLRLKDQSLTSFPACLPRLLQHLDLSANLLPEFNTQKEVDLPILQVLSLRQNKIQQVTLDAWSLSQLQFLDLSFNLLSVVPTRSAPTLPNLKWFSLAGNPIVEIQPLAFSCYPQLHFLNLSSTWLGKDGKRGVKESAFAMTSLPGDTTQNAGSAIQVLDLSATYLERLYQDWIIDLPRLSSLYLTKMSRLRSLDANIFLHLSELRELDCRDSHALSLVETESFAYMPHMAVLIFQNCNLSSFSPWNLSSPEKLKIDLYGNPLVCSCAISWLLSKPDRIVLKRASETLCYPEAKAASSSGPMLLSKFYTECQRQGISHFTQANLYGSSPSFTTDTLPDSSTFPQEWSSSRPAPQSPHLTWADATKEAQTKADILAYKDKRFDRSTGGPPTTASLYNAASSRTLGELSSDLTLASKTEMDQRKHDTTAADETWSHSVPASLPFEETVADSSVSVPHNTIRPVQFTAPLQNPAKAVPWMTLSSTHSSPKSYEDYYDYGKQKEEFVAQDLGPCDYDPCRHLQKPCFDLQLLSPCRCPGISDEFTIPDPPRLREVSEIRDTSAEICWCAPYSAVRFYQLAYRPQDTKKNFTVSGEIYATARRYTLYNLLPGTTYEVCIIASNNAGLSQTTDWNEPGAPCGSFKTKSSYKSIFATLCATSGFFLMATILLSVCLCKKYKGPHIEHYNTHLVSYKNPAFDYSLK